MKRLVSQSYYNIYHNPFLNRCSSMMLMEILPNALNSATISLRDKLKFRYNKKNNVPDPNPDHNKAVLTYVLISNPEPQKLNRQKNDFFFINVEFDLID